MRAYLDQRFSAPPRSPPGARSTSGWPACGAAATSSICIWPDADRSSCGVERVRQRAQRRAIQPRNCTICSRSKPAWLTIGATARSPPQVDRRPRTRRADRSRSPASTPCSEVTGAERDARDDQADGAAAEPDARTGAAETRAESPRARRRRRRTTSANSQRVARRAQQILQRIVLDGVQRRREAPHGQRARRRRCRSATRISGRPSDRFAERSAGGRRTRRAAARRARRAAAGSAR